VLRDQTAWILAHKRDDEPPDTDDAPIGQWRAAYGRLQLWAHMLGYGGRFSTRSRRYSTTLRTLRKARQDWRRRAWHRTADHLADDDTEIVTELGYTGIGWHTTGDAALANSAAARARERRLIAKEERQMHDAFIESVLGEE
jgi:hypothetical protein